MKIKSLGFIVLVVVMGLLTAEYASAQSRNTTRRFTWRLATQREIGMFEQKSLAYGNGKFVAIMRVEGWGERGDALPATKFLYSTDGVNWTIKDNPLSGGDIRFCGGKFFMSVFDGRNASTIYSSTDGENWTESNLRLGGINDIAYGDGKWVLVTYYGQIRYSTDGITWTAARAPSNISSFGVVAYGGGRFITMDGDGRMAHSTDGVTWTVAQGTHGNGVHSLAYGNGRFVKIGWDHSSYSEDGLTWTFVDFFGFSDQTAANTIYSEGMFFSRDYNGRLAYSNDGITWTMIEFNSFNNISNIAYGNGRLVVLEYDIDWDNLGGRPTKRSRIAYSNVQR